MHGVAGWWLVLGGPSASLPSELHGLGHFTTPNFLKGKPTSSLGYVCTTFHRLMRPLIPVQQLTSKRRIGVFSSLLSTSIYIVFYRQLSLCLTHKRPAHIILILLCSRASQLQHSQDNYLYMRKRASKHQNSNGLLYAFLSRNLFRERNSPPSRSVVPRGRRSVPAWRWSACRCSRRPSPGSRPMPGGWNRCWNRCWNRLLSLFDERLGCNFT